jgi:hypothetical protein
MIGKIIFGMFLFFLTLFILGQFFNEKNKDLSKFVQPVCIKNHIYYFIPSPANNNYVIKLDDNGKPIKCEKK